MALANVKCAPVALLLLLLLLLILSALCVLAHAQHNRRLLNTHRKVDRQIERRTKLAAAPTKRSSDTLMHKPLELKLQLNKRQTQSETASEIESETISAKREKQCGSRMRLFFLSIFHSLTPTTNLSASSSEKIDSNLARAARTFFPCSVARKLQLERPTLCGQHTQHTLFSILFSLLCECGGEKAQRFCSFTSTHSLSCTNNNNSSTFALFARKLRPTNTH